jgi:TetR/AcrR family transcriptional regulator
MASVIENSRFETSSITRIMRAARKEFIHHGLEAARLENIAKAAGVSCQLIYHYYQSKQSLYEQMLTEVAKEGIQFLRATDLDKLPPWGALSYVIRGIFEQSAKGYGRLFADQIVHYGAHVSNQNPATSNHSVIVDALDRVLLRGRQAGLFRPEVTACDLFVTIVSMSMAKLNFRQAFAQPDEMTRREATSGAEWQNFTIAFIERGLKL